MKIAVLSFTSGKMQRGVETVVHELCNRWGKTHNVRVYQMGKAQSKDITYAVKEIGTKRDWDIYIKKGNCRLLQSTMLDARNRAALCLTREIIKDLGSWGPDIVMPMNRGWQAALSRLYCWKNNAKIVVSGQAGHKDRWSLMTRPDVFVALSGRSAKWARKYSFGVKIEVIPNGVDLKRFTPKGKKVSIQLRRPIILCVAGSERYKRVEDTIQAVAIMGKSSLLLVGGGERQEKYGKKKLGKRFLRKQYLNKDMPSVYRSADVFTLASDSSEAFGISYIEALACGLPVVAPDDALRREILGENAVYVKDVHNVFGFASALKTATSRNKYRPVKWLKKYNWDTIARKYESLFIAGTRWSIIV